MIFKSKPYYILGSSGFVGRHIADHLEISGKKVFRLSRPAFDLSCPKLFASWDFSGAIIVDCITNVDGSRNAVSATVVDMLQNFLNHLLQSSPARYIYFSTSTTLDSDVVETNHYVSCKKRAEEMVRSFPNSQIIRLSFPFGNGENSMRLITRLIEKVLRGGQISVGDVILPLTPIEFLKTRFLDVVKSDSKEVNFTDGKVYKLRNIVEIIAEALKLDVDCFYDEQNQNDFTLKKQDVFINDIDTMQSLRNMAIKAQLNAAK